MLTDHLMRTVTATCPDASLRDLCFAILAHILDDDNTAYRVAFADENPLPETISAYTLSPKAVHIRTVVEDTLGSEAPQSKATVEAASAADPNAEPESESISFDENRNEIIRSIARLEKMLADDEMLEPDFRLDPKERIAVEAQLLRTRTALSDKFGASEKAEEQYIQVQPKFNTICQYTRHECWLQTKDFAIQHWGLVDPKTQKPSRKKS